jgi:regulator of protease activity HflC (stomatin/prohibitin superfamily)
MDLGNILPSIFENFARLVPVRIVHSYEQGIRFRLGKDISQLDQGMYFFWPFFESIEIESVANRFKETPLQDLVTKDNILVTVAGSFGYSIQSFRKYWIKLQDHENSIENLGQRAIAWAIPRYSFESILDDLRENSNGDGERKEDGFNYDIQRRLKHELNPYGIKVDSFGLTTFTRPKPLRLIVAGGGDRDKIIRSSQL